MSFLWFLFVKSYLYDAKFSWLKYCVHFSLSLMFPVLKSLSYWWPSFYSFHNSIFLIDCFIVILWNIGRKRNAHYVFLSLKLWSYKMYFIVNNLTFSQAEKDLWHCLIQIFSSRKIEPQASEPYFGWHCVNVMSGLKYSRSIIFYYGSWQIIFSSYKIIWWRRSRVWT